MHQARHPQALLAHARSTTCRSIPITARRCACACRRSSATRARNGSRGSSSSGTLPHLLRARRLLGRPGIRMVRGNLRTASAIALALACGSMQPSRASDDRQFFPPPAGSVVERRLVAFNGEGVADRWPAVLSKKRVGSDSGRDFYQWYLSIYELRRDAYRLSYESPGNGGPLSQRDEGIERCEDVVSNPGRIAGWGRHAHACAGCRSSSCRRTKPVPIAAARR